MIEYDVWVVKYRDSKFRPCVRGEFKTLEEAYNEAKMLESTGNHVWAIQRNSF